MQPHESPSPPPMKTPDATNVDPPQTSPDGYYNTAPPFPAPDVDPPTPPDQAALRHHFKSLTHDQLVERLLLAEARLQKYQSATSELVTTLALSPEMTERYYARTLRELLSAALLTLDSVDSLRHVECSMPCVAAEAPHVTMCEWQGLKYSEWQMRWAPHSWWLSVSADGSRWGLGFNVLTRVSEIYLDGVLRCAFSKDLTSVRVSFKEKPRLDMGILSSVGWGVVPIPVRLQIERMVRVEIESFLESRLTGEESMLVVLRRKALARLSDDDLLEAKDQAIRASSINLHSALLL